MSTNAKNLRNTDLPLSHSSLDKYVASLAISTYTENGNRKGGFLWKLNFLTKQEGLFNSYCAAHPFGDVLQTTNWGRLKAQSGWSYYPPGSPKRRGDFSQCPDFGQKTAFSAPTAFSIHRGGRFIPHPRLYRALLAAGRELALEKDAVVWKMDPAIPAADSGMAGAGGGRRSATCGHGP